jgi:hypothetical protein
MSAFEDELDKKLDECIEEMEENKDITISAEEADEEVLELTFEQLISAINQKYLDYMKKCLSIFENHETLSKSISHDIEYLTNKLETNPYACLITLTDNYLYCFEQIKDRNSDFFIYQKEKYVKKNGKTVKNKITKIGNKTPLKQILENIKGETSNELFGIIVDIFKLLIYEDDNIFCFHDDYIEFINENFQNNKNFNKMNIVIENIDSLIGNLDNELLEAEEYEKEMKEKNEDSKKKNKKGKNKNEPNIGADFIKGIEDTKIAQMAKNISEKINLEDYPILSDPTKLLSSLTNPEQGLSSIGGLMDVVMKEVQGAFKDTDSTENDLVNEAQNIMGKLSGTGLDPANLMKNMNLDMDKFADIFNKGK